MRRFATIALTVVFGLSLAHADVIDFSTAPVVPTASFTIGGVTFSAVGGGGMLAAATTPNGTAGLLDFNSPHKVLRADIAGGASFVSVDLGDFDADPDTLFLNIFNAANVSLGSVSLLIDASFTGMKTLSLAATGIAYAEFGATDPAINGSSVYADNFTFTPSAAVPEPSAVLLFGSVAAGLLLYRRRSAR